MPSAESQPAMGSTREVTPPAAVAKVPMGVLSEGLEAHASDNARFLNSGREKKPSAVGAQETATVLTLA